jgi:hypothetical protein
MKTVRVRVFVSVAPTGGWAAAGNWMLLDDQVQKEANHIPNRDDGYWIEADLPLPNQSPEIVATVTRAE